MYSICTSIFAAYIKEGVTAAPDPDCLYGDANLDGAVTLDDVVAVNRNLMYGNYLYEQYGESAYSLTLTAADAVYDPSTDESVMIFINAKTDAVYDSSAKTVTFTTMHFSLYTIEAVEEELPQTGSNSWNSGILTAGAAALIGAGSWMVLSAKRRRTPEA